MYLFKGFTNTTHHNPHIPIGMCGDCGSVGGWIHMLPHKPQQHHRGHIVGVWGGQKVIEFLRKTALG